MHLKHICGRVMKSHIRAQDALNIYANIEHPIHILIRSEYNMHRKSATITYVFNIHPKYFRMSSRIE